MRIEVHREVCEGHGLCEQTSPTIYEVDDEGYVRLRLTDIPDDQEAAAQAGARVCPVAALKVVQ